MIDIEEIKKILPHRYPFLLVDRVIEYQKDEWIKTIKNVTINEPFFMGHFPKQALMPGVLVIEAMAQSGGILSFLSLDEEEFKKSVNGEKKVYFMQIDKAKFRKPIVPGDRLEMHVKILKRKMKVWKMQGECFVDGVLAAEATMMAKLD
jgi:3-hydroxyacyl-[acyl-carrier-protein] dehydratase